MPRGAQGLGSIHKRASDGLWCAVAQLGRDPTTGKRQRRSFYARTQKEALAKRKKFLRDLEDGLVSAAATKRKGYTVATWLDYWLANVIAPEREPTTLDGYTQTINKHVKPYIGGILLPALSPEHVEAWLKALRERTPRPVGLRTRQLALQRLRTALTEALRRREQTGVRFNAATPVRMPRGPTRSVPPPNLEDARALLAAARGQRLEAFVIVILALGLRRGEALGLRWEDIDLDGRQVRIRRRVSYVSGLGVIVRSGTKMHPDQEWTVPMPMLAVEALRAHRARQARDRLPTGYVFTTAAGGLLGPRSAEQFFARVRTIAGQEEKTLHQLRHDCASLLLAQGVPLWAVSQILRHKTPAVTAQYYAHLTAEVHMDAADRMDDVLRPLLRST